MIGKTALTVLVLAVLLGSISCRREGTKTGGAARSAEPAPPPTTVGEQPPGAETAQQPPATAGGQPSATVPSAREPVQPQQPTGVSTEIAAKEKKEKRK